MFVRTPLINKVLSHNLCFDPHWVFGLRTIFVYDLKFAPLHDLSLGSILPTPRPIWQTIFLIHDLLDIPFCPFLPIQSCFEMERCPLIRSFHIAFLVHHVSIMSYDYNDWCHFPCFQCQDLVKIYLQDLVFTNPNNDFLF